MQHCKTLFSVILGLCFSAPLSAQPAPHHSQEEPVARAHTTARKRVQLASRHGRLQPRLPVAPQGRKLTVGSTAYCLRGYTASGTYVNYGTVAVDPRVIPMGTRMYIPGYGEAIARDTGGAIIGNKIDVWFPSSGQCYQWGYRTVTITILDEPRRPRRGRR